MQISPHFTLGVPTKKLEVFLEVVQVLARAFNNVCNEDHRLIGSEFEFYTIRIKPSSIGLSNNFVELSLYNPMGKRVGKALLRFRTNNDGELVDLVLNNRAVSPNEIFWVITKDAPIPA